MNMIDDASGWMSVGKMGGAMSGWPNSLFRRKQTKQKYTWHPCPTAAPHHMRMHSSAISTALFRHKQTNKKAPATVRARASPITIAISAMNNNSKNNSNNKQQWQDQSQQEDQEKERKCQQCDDWVCVIKISAPSVPCDACASDCPTRTIDDPATDTVSATHISGGTSSPSTSLDPPAMTKIPSIWIMETVYLLTKKEKKKKKKKEKKKRAQATVYMGAQLTHAGA